MPDRLTLSEARRIALSASGFARPRPLSPVSPDDIRRVILELGVLQLDFVNVLVPAHYFVLFSRLGGYDRALFDGAAYRSRVFTEQWAHEASLVPMDVWPLLRHRMENHRVRPWGFETFMERNPAYVSAVLEEVRRRGPLTADQLPPPEGAPARIPGAWFGSFVRAVLEAHFGRGLLAVVERRPDFARVYDLAERVVPAGHFNRAIEPDAAQRELVRRAARSLGIATAADLADYYRMSVRETRPHITALLRQGALREVSVDGWREPAYLYDGAARPERVQATALLSPFDPLVWFRPRVRRLFEFDYTLEIFVPAEARTWGYYVLPFLHGDRLVARVDLKADRTARRLAVPAAYSEPHTEPSTFIADLAAELRGIACWLGLESVSAGRRGGLARALGAALREAG